MNAIFPQYASTYLANTNLGLFSDARVDNVIVGPPEVSPSTTGGRLTWGAAVFQRVLQLASLGENWDGRGSSRVAPDTLAFVLVLLTQTMPPDAPAPGMIPLGKGGVQLIWHTVDAELEVEVAKPNDVYIYYLDCASGVERETHTATQLKELSDVMWRVFRT